MGKIFYKFGTLYTEYVDVNEIAYVNVDEEYLILNSGKELSMDKEQLKELMFKIESGTINGY